MGISGSGLQAQVDFAGYTSRFEGFRLSVSVFWGLGCSLVYRTIRAGQNTEKPLGGSLALCLCSGLLLQVGSEIGIVFYGKPPNHQSFVTSVYNIESTTVRVSSGIRSL